MCRSINSIKYVLKYVYKGCDQATFALCSDQVDEISECQNARFREPSKDHLDRILCFALCQGDDFAKTLLYVDFPEYYTWNNKSWERRKQGTQVAGYPGVKQAQALGRVYTISPRQGECFYLCLLLHNVKDPQSFAALRTVDGGPCSYFREACLKLGLLEDSNQYHLAMEEAIVVIEYVRFIYYVM